jgi:hypothetical protein
VGVFWDRIVRDDALRLIFYSCASVFDVSPLLMGRESTRSYNPSAT